MSEIVFEDVRRASATLDKIAWITPIKTSASLDTAAGATVFLKCENFQRTGAFKFRGAYNALSTLPRIPSATVTTISSGNHGQGLALAATLLGFSAHVIIPKPHTHLKYDRILSQQARVTIAENRTQAEVLLSHVLREEGAHFVHPFNDPNVIAGQGTVMLELLEQVDNLDIVLAPVGGGGLLSGLCVAGHHLDPKLVIYACEPLCAADAVESLRQGKIVPMSNPDTMADGLRTSLGTLTFPILKQHVADVFLVSENEILAAMQFIHDQFQFQIEPSSAVALAPLLRQERRLTGKRVGVVLTGGNVGQFPGEDREISRNQDGLGAT
ncbi:MAG: pyridoxal-phosphate dependent enzyme [Nitrospira sp.]